LVRGVTYLLDTHVLLWWLNNDPRLSAVHLDAISEGTIEIVVSSITLAELSIKASLGKLDITTDLNTVIESDGFSFLPFTERHAATLRTLPFHHRDPFDRMLVSQAQTDGLVFLTADERCKKYDIQTR
jgi:PIN domain nuclease of toxin-antitoxin system